MKIEPGRPRKERGGRSKSPLVAFGVCILLTSACKKDGPCPDHDDCPGLATLCECEDGRIVHFELDQNADGVADVHRDWTYDDEGRPTSEVNRFLEDGRRWERTTSWRYDDEGNLTRTRTETDRGVQTHQYEYDSENRVVSYYMEPDDSHDLREAYRYDSEGRCARVEVDGGWPSQVDGRVDERWRFTYERGTALQTVVYELDDVRPRQTLRIYCRYDPPCRAPYGGCSFTVAMEPESLAAEVESNLRQQFGGSGDLGEISCRGVRWCPESPEAEPRYVDHWY